MKSFQQQQILFHKSLLASISQVFACFYFTSLCLLLFHKSLFASISPVFVWDDIHMSESRPSSNTMRHASFFQRANASHVHICNIFSGISIATCQSNTLCALVCSSTHKRWKRHWPSHERIYIYIGHRMLSFPMLMPSAQVACWWRACASSLAPLQRA